MMMIQVAVNGIQIARPAQQKHRAQQYGIGVFLGRWLQVLGWRPKPLVKHSQQISTPTKDEELGVWLGMIKVSKVQAPHHSQQSSETLMSSAGTDPYDWKVLSESRKVKRIFQQNQITAKRNTTTSRSQQPLPFSRYERMAANQ